MPVTRAFACVCIVWSAGSGIGAPAQSENRPVTPIVAPPAVGAPAPVPVAAVPDADTNPGVALASAPASAPSVAIEPAAADHLRRMSDFMRQQRRFSYRAEHEFDVVEDDGHKLLMTRSLEASVTRPNRIQARSRGFGGRTEYLYDGSHVTLIDADAREYSRVPAPDAIDPMLELMSERYGLSVPTSDLLSADVFATLTRFVTNGRLVGPAEVGGQACHHLAFEQDSVDWQIWISAGEHPFPFKLVLNYKFEESCPVFLARFADWKTGEQVAAVSFEFAPPTGYREVTLERVDEPDPSDETEPPPTSPNPPPSQSTPSPTSPPTNPPSHPQR